LPYVHVTIFSSLLALDGLVWMNRETFRFFQSSLGIEWQLTPINVFPILINSN